MRFAAVGLSIWLCCCSVGLAQVTGFVESVGFDNHFRSDCWTPLLINLSSQSSQTQTFQIQIVQQDLDRDNVTFTREVTVNAGQQQKFWAYFIPQPTNAGLPTQTSDLQRVLKVYLATAPDGSGRGKQLSELPIRLTLTNLDPAQKDANGALMGFGAVASQKLVIWISDGSSRPSGFDYSHNLVVGAKQELAEVSLHPRDLPENVLGYDAVDTVIWFSGDADQLDESGAHRLEALEAFVRRGGHLVICQNENLHRVDALARLLPIDPRETKLLHRDSLDPLPALFAKARASGGDDSELWKKRAATLHLQTAHGKANDDAVVEDWIDWSGDGKDRTPWLCRRPVGLGSVSWVAQDLGNPTLAIQSGAWQPVWDHVLGWNNATQLSRFASENTVKRYEANSDEFFDLEKPLMDGLDHEGKGAGLIGIAIGFFAVYWLVAGPGIYLFLANQKRTEASWFVFAATAIVATGLTVILVKLTLRGPPEVSHTSVVRNASGEHAQVDSRIGLYIPRDGNQAIELLDTATDAQSVVSPLIVHPDSVARSNDFPSSEDYTVAIHDGEEPPKVTIPFRSTLKKLEARWVGDLGGGITGTPALIPPAGSAGKGYITGDIANATGYDLDNVYLMFTYPSGGKNLDWVLYVPSWKHADTLELHKIFDAAPLLNTAGREVDLNRNNYKGWIDGQWSTLWYQMISSRKEANRCVMPILTAFDLMPPPENFGTESKAFFLYPRSGRSLNLSGAIRAGRMVILAEAQTPLPCPMKVDELKMNGGGQTILQMVIPIDRTALNAPATQPAATSKPVF